MSAPVPFDSPDFAGTAAAVVVVAGVGVFVTVWPGFCAISLLAGFALGSSSNSPADKHPSATNSPARPFLFFFFFCPALTPDAAAAGLLAVGAAREVEAAGAGDTAGTVDRGFFSLVVASAATSVVVPVLGADLPDNRLVKVSNGEARPVADDDAAASFFSVNAVAGFDEDA